MTKCRGCGVLLQNTDFNGLGYTEKMESKLCRRCFRLVNYGEYENVDFTNDDFNNLLDTIPKDSLIIYTCDILSLNLDRINNYNNVTVVITKRDIMPKSIKDEKIINYVKKRCICNDVFIISSKNDYNIDNFYNYLCKYDNKSIFFVGDTNSGKSTLINRLVKNYGIDKNHKVTVSMYPSTTLSFVSINLGPLNVIDTPGIINHDSIVNYLDKVGLKRVSPVKEIKPKSCQIEGKGSIVIDKYTRIDYVAKKRTSIVIYASNSLDIRFNSLKNDYLKDYAKHSFSIDKKKDVVISGLCFIRIMDSIELDLYVFPNISVYLRDSLI